MCDTIAVVQPDRVLFAKNSDRDANEAQILEWHPRRAYSKGEKLRCTHIEIPQAEQTFAIVISRPFWIWGAEIGSNEFGVTIGNEAVFTNQPYATSGLLGMDLLRLALERAQTASEACDVIARLLEMHGQGGGCGLENRNFTYHNSFIVADPKEAFVFETAGTKWAVEVVTGARTISNGLTIPDFARRYSDTLYTWASSCRSRRCRTQALASTACSAADLIRILQDHGDGSEHPCYNAFNGGLTAPCVHGGGIVAASQTTGSWVADLRPGGCDHWVTGTAAPCISLFKPVAVNTPIDVGNPTDVADGSLWWRHERLHRMVTRNPEDLRRLFIAERDAIQEQWIETPPSSEQAFADGDRLLCEWTSVVTAHNANDGRPWYVKRYWRKRDRAARLHSIFDFGS